MADKVLGKYKSQVAEVALVPSAGGAFEISVAGEQVYSKLQTGKFPDEKALLGEMDGKV